MAGLDPNPIDVNRAGDLCQGGMQVIAWAGRGTAGGDEQVARCYVTGKGRTGCCESVRDVLGDIHPTSGPGDPSGNLRAEGIANPTIGRHPRGEQLISQQQDGHPRSTMDGDPVVAGGGQQPGQGWGDGGAGGGDHLTPSALLPGLPDVAAGIDRTIEDLPGSARMLPAQDRIGRRWHHGSGGDPDGLPGYQAPPKWLSCGDVSGDPPWPGPADGPAVHRRGGEAGQVAVGMAILSQYPMIEFADRYFLDRGGMAKGAGNHAGLHPVRLALHIRSLCGQGSGIFGRVHPIASVDMRADQPVLDSEALHQRHAHARRVIQQAGALALDFFGRRDELVVDSKGRHDVVTEADRAVEAFITEQLLSAFPQDRVLGEESGASGSGSDGPLWVIDPIDGTQEFARGTRNWCVVIALVDADGCASGLVFHPSADELFEAHRGGPALLNEQPIRASSATSLTQGVVSLEYSPRQPKSAILAALERLIDAGGTFVRGGSGALGIVHVACGRSLGFAEAHMQPWDCLAAMYVVTRAGGRCNDFIAEGSMDGGGRVIAAAPALFDQVSALLDPAPGVAPFVE